MASVVAQSHFIFGLRTGVNNNLCYIDEQTLVFPSGNNCVCYNTVQRCQRFIPGSENSRGMHAMAVSANRRYLAVSERGEKATVTVFDLQHERGRKRKVLTAGDASIGEFVCMAFSPDSKYLIGQTGAPEWTLIFWLWEKQKILATVKTSSSSSPVSQVSFNPHNNTQLCASGAGVFKLFRYSEGALKQSCFPKVASFNFLCHAWLTEERVIAGTDGGRLLVFESGNLRREIDVAAQGRSDRLAEVKKIKDSGGDEGPGAAPCVRALLSHSGGFACSLGSGSVCLFEKNEEDSFTLSREIRIAPEPDGEELTPADGREIQTMCMSPAEEAVSISTDGGQLYTFSLSSGETNKLHEEDARFDFLLQPFHSRSITGLSLCIRKPVVATSSLDRSVRIWNYETKTLELCKEFQEEAHSVALHPTGFSVLVGFSDKLRLMHLLVDDIRTFQEFSVRGCRECAFSRGGHMFAAADGTVIHIYSVTSLENVLNLKGHNGKVRGIEWSRDDSRLVSCGMDGAVYEWNTQTAKLESESVLKSCSYTGVAFSSDCKTILAVGTDLTLKEIQDCQVLREVPAAEAAHTAVAVSRSSRVVFTGTSSGTIRAIKYPLPTEKDWLTYQAHCGPVTKMAITFDDQFLLTASEDGCLSMWKIVDKEGRGLRSVRRVVHTEEILVTKSDLEEKAQSALELKTRLEALQMENEYHLRLKDMNYNERMRELSDTLTQQIELLKTSEQALRTQMDKQDRENQQSSAQIAARHAEELKRLESSSSQKLIVEHERYQDLQHECQRLQEDYENRLEAAEESKTQALEELTQRYEVPLQEKTRLVVQCQEEAQQEILMFKEIVKQVEEDEERIIHDVKVKYERKLLAEKKSNSNLKGEAGAMTQKFYSLKKQLDERDAEMNAMKHERQKLLGLIRSLESDIEDLKRQISGHERTNQDKDKTISTLKKKNQELEKLKFVLDFQLNEFKKQIEPQQDDIAEKKERIRQLEEELLQISGSNTHLKLTASDLRLKLRAREKEVQKETQKVKDMETRLQRLKSDLHTCVSFIQEPRKLKDSVQAIHARYVAQSDGVDRSSDDEDDVQAFRQQREHLEKTVSSLKSRLAKSAEEHDKVHAKITKENVTLITEINELRKELSLTKTRVKEHEAQLAAVTRKTNKTRVKSEEGPKQEERH
ncbi:cilia- and flagella-associated protein 57 [Brachionichthys hirsutus]|uniref:cilia- and flagella-associated protein 57 n=1 Tax=Brachionichthys hirsutus TaxID=412623 RepID=UPI0036053EFF